MNAAKNAIVLFMKNKRISKHAIKNFVWENIWLVNSRDCNRPKSSDHRPLPTRKWNVLPFASCPYSRWKIYEEKEHFIVSLCLGIVTQQTWKFKTNILHTLLHSMQRGEKKIRFYSVTLTRDVQRQLNALYTCLSPMCYHAPHLIWVSYPPHIIKIERTNHEDQPIRQHCSNTQHICICMHDTNNTRTQMARM